MSRHDPPGALLGRVRECDALDELLTSARAGRSQVLVLQGDAGVGKTALLDYLLARASGCRVARSTGVESEMELPYAGLHQLCGPLLDHVERLPPPQRDALQTAFGLRTGAVPDRFMVGLAVLGLIAEVAAESPLICVVDDAQWLDRATTQTLTFVARRLLAEPVGVVFALREFEQAQDLSALTRLSIEGLAEAEAHALLDTVITGPLEEPVRRRIVAETHGNPLAILEFPQGLNATQMAFGVDIHSTPLVNRLEEGFLRRVEPLPAPTRLLLLVAAAEPSGNEVLLWRAASLLGLDPGTGDEAVSAGLIEFRRGVRFRHSLVRSAIYRAADDGDRRKVHGALAAATDSQLDPDRRAWHLAQASTIPDDDVADVLEASAGRAQTRGGVAAAAAFLEHSARMTSDPTRRARRALAAAQAHHRSGGYEAALKLLAQAAAGSLTELEQAEGELLRAQITFTTTFGADAPPMLLNAAQRLQPLDPRLARNTFLEAMVAARFAANDNGQMIVGVAQAVRAAPPASDPVTATDQLVDALAVRFTDGYPAGAPLIKRALSAFDSPQLSPAEGLSWLWYASMTALEMWDDSAWSALADRHVRLVRELGLLPLLPIALSTRSAVHVCAGELREAAILTDEAQRVTDVLGGQLGPYALLNFAATQGDEEESLQLIETALAEVEAHGQGMGVVIVNFAGALLYNGLGRYEDALEAAERSVVLSEDLGGNQWSLAELVEAAHHAGQPARGAEALRRFIRTTDAAGTDWALGLQSVLRALMTDDEDADHLFQEGIERLARTKIRLASARAQLLYGEWLRREGRRIEARQHLRTAYELLSAMGVEGFAERARRELAATGETARRRSQETVVELTTQEEQIARLAADGLTNTEIGTQLFISARTVEWHLRKVFTKLDLTSRRQLRGALPPRVATASA